MKGTQKALLCIAVVVMMLVTCFAASASIPPASAEMKFDKEKLGELLGEYTFPTEFPAISPITTIYPIESKYPTVTKYPSITKIPEITSYPITTTGIPTEIDTSSVDIWLPKPDVTLYPAVTVTPTSTGGSTSSLPVITKDPTDETVNEGGECWFIANYSNALYAVWHGVSVDLIVPESATTVIDTDRGFIYGLKAGITRDELVNEYLGVVGNGHLEVSTGAIGTGTVVQLIDDYNGNVLEEYQIVIFGDTNGDGLINSTDVTNIRMMNAGLIEASFNDVYTFAADLYPDGNITSSDITAIRMLNAGVADYDQVTREII